MEGVTATLPQCPRCATPVEADWDWCRQCGYDPDGLRPERVEPGPPPPPRPTATVYGLLPYDHPSSVAPVEPEEPDHDEQINRRFATVALCVIVVGLALLIAMLVIG